MLKTLTYSYPRNTYRIMKSHSGSIDKFIDFIVNIYIVLKLAIMMLLIGALMVGGLFIVVGAPYLLISIFI